jgi:hypothetical protein
MARGTLFRKVSPTAWPALREAVEADVLDKHNQGKGERDLHKYQDAGP